MKKMRIQICLTIGQAVFEFLLLGVLLFASFWGLQFAVEELGIELTLTAILATLAFAVFAITAIIYRAVVKIDSIESKAEAEAEAAKQKENRLAPYL
jgi:hypothetical protein